jgi:hypothetical protein
MKKKLIILSVTGVIGLLAALLVYVYVYNKPHRDIPGATPDAEVSAEALYHAFTHDHDRALAEYMDKVLEVTGTVDAIEYAGDLPVAVFHFDDGPFGLQGVRCTFAGSETAADLQPGMTVSIKGHCTGFTGEDVILMHCTLVN